MGSISRYPSLGLGFNTEQDTWWASLVAQTVKNLPAMQETQLRSLGQEDPLERENPMNKGAWQATVYEGLKE